MTLHLTSCRHADVDEETGRELAVLLEEGILELKIRPLRIRTIKGWREERLCAAALRRICGEDKG